MSAVSQNSRVMAWRAGQRLQNGEYTIERILGVGGFGITYLARQRDARPDQAWVVIKTLNDTVRHRSDFANFQTRLQQDFLNEALKLARCHHLHVVQVKELIRAQASEGTIDGIVMEYIEGASLAARLSQGVLPETEALRYVRQVGEALTVVHDRGLLHRDIKPHNIMIRSGTSEAVLIDFGLAREFIDDTTQTHSNFLTHGFAPPEQYHRRDRRGTYTDVYALAATLYCLLTNHVPPAAYMRLSGTALKSPKRLNSGISDQVNQAILRGLELRAENRPQSMQAWLDLLGEPIAQSVAAVKPATVQAQPPFREAAQVSTQHHRTLSARRRSRIIPWRSLAFVLAGYATTGGLLIGLSAPLWAVAVAVLFAVYEAWDASEVGAVAVSMAVFAAAYMHKVWAWAWAVFGAMAVIPAAFGAWTLAVILAVMIPVILAVMWAWVVGVPMVGEKLLESFNQSHTFLILVGTSLAGLGLGWWIGATLRLSGFVLPI